MGIHLSSDVISTWSIIASVQLGVPFSLPVFSDAASHSVGVGPGQGGVVTDGRRESERFYAATAEKFDLIIPISDRSGPIRGRTSLCLFVDV